MLLPNLKKIQISGGWNSLVDIKLGEITIMNFSHGRYFKNYCYLYNRGIFLPVCVYTQCVYSVYCLVTWWKLFFSFFFPINPFLHPPPPLSGISHLQSLVLLIMATCNVLKGQYNNIFLPCSFAMWKWGPVIYKWKLCRLYICIASLAPKQAFSLIQIAW